MLSSVDEIHELPPVAQTTLYRCLEERRLFLGGDRKSITLPPFTFIGATTDQWALSKPLRDRFKIILHLTHYSQDEIAELMTQRAKRLRWTISSDAITALAIRGRGTPRIAIRLLEAARRTARAEGAEVISADHVKRMCEIESYDAIGLDSLERRYLQLLREAQGPIRLNVIATHLGLPRRTVEGIIESELIRLGLVSKADDGRTLTAAGAKHLSECSAAEESLNMPNQNIQPARVRAVVSVSGMAQAVRLSRSRFWDHVRRGVFPEARLLADHQAAVLHGRSPGGDHRGPPDRHRLQWRVRRLLRAICKPALRRKRCPPETGSVMWLCVTSAILLPDSVRWD